MEPSNFLYLFFIFPALLVIPMIIIILKGIIFFWFIALGYENHYHDTPWKWWKFGNKK